ncbi:hypothetical protein JW998_05820 [candidate division KSB1 bacterium]|nr:hypothetical protein [candidate division KSB1 bacterium]
MEINLIQAYSRGQLSDRERAQVARLRKSRPDLRLLFDLIDACRRLASPKTGRVAPISRQQAELLFIRLLSFNIRRRHAAAFLAQLGDASFLALLQPLLVTATTPATEVDEPGVRIRSDAEIYHSLIAQLDAAPARRISGFSPFFIDYARRLRKPVIIALSAIACAAILVMRSAGHPLYIKYFETGQPVMFDSSAGSAALRSSPAKDGGERDEIGADFKLALASYVDGRYREALAQFVRIEKSASLSQWSPAVSNDFYLYYGLTHLQLAGRRGRKAHVDEAIRCLSLCAEDERQERREAALFFLALAHSMRGDEQSAARSLRAIQPQSIYFEDAQKLEH